MLLVTLATNFLFLFFFQTSFSSLFFASILYHNTQASATLSLRLLLMVLIENIALFDTSMLNIIFSFFFFFFCCFSWFTSTRQCIVPRQQHQSQMTWHCYSHGKQTFNLMQYLFQGSDIFRTNLLCINVLLEPNNKFPVRSGFDSY